METQLKKLKNWFDILDDYKIIIKHEHHDFPTAIIHPNKISEIEPGKVVMVIKVNKPSLIRYALIDLICHEIAEHRFYEEYPNYKGNSHKHKKFQEIERALRKNIEKKIYEEHG